MSFLSRFAGQLPPASYDLDPALTGRVWLITGATNGIGLELARYIACEGRRIILPARNAERAENVAAELRAAGAQVDVLSLDLASLDSVAEAAKAVRSLDTPIDVLVNNAGGVQPRRRYTTDGFEMILATNFLGPFAFTNQVADIVTSRIVMTSSHTHRLGHVDLVDPHYRHRKWSWTSAYAQSKLAMQMWAYALQRRLSAAGRTTLVQTGHPGWSATNIQNVSGIAVVDRIADAACQAVAMSAKEGATVLLEAAVGNHAPASYIGPGGLLHMWGKPVRQRPAAIARDADATNRLWRFAAVETGTDLDLSAT